MPFSDCPNADPNKLAVFSYQKKSRKDLSGGSEEIKVLAWTAAKEPTQDERHFRGQSITNLLTCGNASFSHRAKQELASKHKPTT